MVENHNGVGFRPFKHNYTFADHSMKKSKKALGVYLTYILRHAPEAIQIEMDSQGWVNIEDLVNKSVGVRDFTRDELVKEVQADTKVRFQIHEDGTKVRCVQGHSLDFVLLDLKPYQGDDFVFHGTSTKSIEKIKVEGIKKMSRQYVHLSRDPSTAFVVGQRHGKPDILKVDVGQMLRDGLKVFVAENGVILTDFVDPKYFSSTSILENIWSQKP